MEKTINGNSVKMPGFPAVPVRDSREMIRLQVASENGAEYLTLSAEELSRHILTVGSIGSGKTNLIDLLICQLSGSMTADDVMVIFDTKGDYLRKFARRGDLVFGNIEALPDGVESAKWNIYEEVAIDREHITENLVEITKSLFSERVKHNTNPFFPNAARDILFGYMLTMLRSGAPADLNNRALASFFGGLDIQTLRDLLGSQPDLQSCLYYIKGDNLQTQGVISEVVQLVREIFVDKFALNGTASIRKAIRNKGRRKIFIEYDLGLGNMLTPVYRLLLDMAIKEALCRNDSRRGNVYVVIDEFSLLPDLQHISDGVNFGRELGIKLIVGLQSIEQMFAAYGEHLAGSILAGFDNRFFFKVNDYQSRKYVQELLGKNKSQYTYSATNREKGSVDEIVDGNVLEDWEYLKLPAGAAVFHQSGKQAKIIGLPQFRGPDTPPVNHFLPGGLPGGSNLSGTSASVRFRKIR